MNFIFGHEYLSKLLTIKNILENYFSALLLLFIEKNNTKYNKYFFIE